MEYCHRCLYTSIHPLGLSIDEEGICSGCRVHEEKDEIDWKEKEEEFAQILNQYRDRPGSSYDCVIPVNGNGDSFFVVDTVKKKYGLNPLLVTYNVQSNTKIGVRNLARLISKLDCDHLNYTVSPKIAREITRITMHKMGDIYWHVLAGSQTFPVQVATKLKIPLVIWGVHGWLDQVGMFSHYDSVEMTKKVRKEHGLRRVDAEDLLGESDKISAKDLQAFTYPSDQQLEESRVRGLYLGNFVRWDAQKQVEDMVEKYGYETSEEERSFNKYETIFCWNNAGTHDFIKYLKYGYGKATDHGTRDIRLKRLSRDEALNLAKHYDQKIPEKSLNLFLNWLGLTKEAFYNCIDQFRDPNAWFKNEKGEWELKTPSAELSSKKAFDSAKLDNCKTKEYLQTSNLEKTKSEEKYVLMGRSYLDDNDYKAIEG